MAPQRRTLLPAGQPGATGDRFPQGAAGGGWIPRHLLCDLVDGYRKGSGQTLLTAREEEIVRRLMAGASNTEIADNLFVSEHTIKSHLDNMFKKLNVKNRLQAVSWAKESL